MILTILVGTDGSEAAAAAERYGVGLAARLKARLASVSVVEDRLTRAFSEDGLGVSPPSLDSLATYLQSRADAAGRRIGDSARTAGIEITFETSQGIADDRIVER